MSINEYKKFIEHYNVDDYEILTEDGWADITHSNKTIKYKVYNIKLENQLELKCADNHILIDENYNEVFAINSLNKYIRTKYGVSKVILIEDLNYYEEMYDLTVDSENHTYYTNDILSHNTTINALYITWCLCFQKDWVALVVANEDELKKEIVEMIQTIYESLPPFLQLGIETWNKGAITVKVPTTNGVKSSNKLKSAVAGKNAGRGKTPNFVLADESAWYEPTKAKAFFDSVKASLSSGDNNKFVMISTPNGYNIFHQYWKDAKEGNSKFKTFFANWKVVPGRDENWKNRKIEEDNLTIEEWLQNYECSFLGSSSTLLEPEMLEKLKWKKPLVEDYIIDNLKLYKEINTNGLYVITVDTSKTVGKEKSSNDYISVNVLELTNKIEQVATWRSNEYHYTELAEILSKIGELFNYALIVVENNEGSGQSTVDRLVEVYEYENVYKDPKHDGEINGVRQTTQRRQVSLSTLKKLIKQDILIINDEDTIAEFFTFIKIGKKYQADIGAGATDDIIMSLCMIVLVLIDSKNDLEITLDDYLAGEVEIIDNSDTEDVNFFNASYMPPEQEDISWLFS